MPDSTSLDKSSQGKARRRLNAIRQGKTHLPGPPRRVSTSTNGGEGHARNDAIKLGFLDEALSWDMKDRMSLVSWLKTREAVLEAAFTLADDIIQLLRRYFLVALSKKVNSRWLD